MGLYGGQRFRAGNTVFAQNDGIDKAVAAPQRVDKGINHTRHFQAPVSEVVLITARCGSAQAFFIARQQAFVAFGVGAADHLQQYGGTVDTGRHALQHGSGLGGLVLTAARHGGNYGYVYTT